MIFEDRWYQTECVDAIWKYFETQSGNPLCALPTGTGKAVIIAKLLQRIYQYFPNQKVLVCTHVKELVQQNYNKMMSMWPECPAGINSASLGQRDYAQRVIFAGIGSVAKSAQAFGKVDLLLIDEAHLVSDSEDTLYRKFIKDLLKINPYLKVIGFTATPWRQGVGTLIDNGLFTHICYDVTGLEAFNRLIAERYLCPVVPKKTKEILDVDGLHIRGGEYKLDELNALVNNDQITERAVLEALNGAADRKHWLWFCAGVEHAERTADCLNYYGIKTVAIHSKMGDTARDKAIEDFKAGKYRAATNNNILTTGFDFPEIDFLGILRPTLSVNLWVQMLGRGTRPAPWANKINCLVFDFANNTKRLGPINDPYLPRKKGKGGGDAPVKECPVCNSWVAASSRFCGGKSKDDPAFDAALGCGHEFHFSIKYGSEASTEEMIKGDLPEVKSFQVSDVVYSVHTRVGAPKAMRVTYYCGLRKFDEYVCLEHHDNPTASKLARQWWRARLSIQGLEENMPITTDQGFQMVEYLPAATHVRVWVNRKYPRILAHCFDGTDFGSIPAEDRVDPPTVKVDQRAVISAQPAMSFTGMDDDIPF